MIDNEQIQREKNIKWNEKQAQNNQIERNVE